MKPIRIRHQLELKGLTQVDLAKKLNISRSTVSKVIRRERTSLRVARAISTALDRPLEEVFPEYWKEAA